MCFSTNHANLASCEVLLGVANTLSWQCASSANVSHLPCTVSLLCNLCALI